jgi:hypothetical protein
MQTFCRVYRYDGIKRVNFPPRAVKAGGGF